MIRVKIVVYDNHNKVFERNTTPTSSMVQAGNFLQTKFGLPLKVVSTRKNKAKKNKAKMVTAKKSNVKRTK